MNIALQIILVALASFVIAQLLKVVSESIFKRTLSFKPFLESGGMPSGHSAIMAALTVAIYLIQGFSALFSLSLVLSLLIMYDAAGVRHETERHAKILNQIIKRNKLKIKLLSEAVGHNALEVIMGAILGILVAVVLI